MVGTVRKGSTSATEKVHVDFFTGNELHEIFGKKENFRKFGGRRCPPGDFRFPMGREFFWGAECDRGEKVEEFERGPNRIGR